MIIIILIYKLGRGRKLRMGSKRFEEKHGNPLGTNWSGSGQNNW